MVKTLLSSSFFSSSRLQHLQTSKLTFLFKRERERERERVSHTHRARKKIPQENASFHSFHTPQFLSFTSRLPIPNFFFHHSHKHHSPVTSSAAPSASQVTAAPFCFGVRFFFFFFRLFFHFFVLSFYRFFFSSIMSFLLTVIISWVRHALRCCMWDGLMECPSRPLIEG
jgi:hypothetical protein